MSEKFIFVASVILMAALVIGLVYLCFRIKYQYSIELDEHTELIEPLQKVSDTYTVKEMDRLIKAIETGEFKDDRST